MVSKWIIAHIEGKIEIKGKILAMPISAELGYSIIRKAYKYKDLNEEDYDMMKDTVFKGVKTDSTMRTQMECNHSIPSPELKAKIWDWLSNPIMA
jgi:hypothetical protein